MWIIGKSIHDEIAEELVKKFRAEYKKDKEIDIVTRNRVIEVETKKNSLSQSKKQVQNSPKVGYIAVNKIDKKNALNATKGTSISIMGQIGRIVKKAERKK